MPTRVTSDDSGTRVAVPGPPGRGRGPETDKPPGVGGTGWQEEEKEEDEEEDEDEEEEEEEEVANADDLYLLESTPAAGLTFQRRNKRGGKDAGKYDYQTDFDLDGKTDTVTNKENTFNLAELMYVLATINKKLFVALVKPGLTGVAANVDRGIEQLLTRAFEELFRDKLAPRVRVLRPEKGARPAQFELADLRDGSKDYLRDFVEVVRAFQKVGDKLATARSASGKKAHQDALRAAFGILDVARPRMFRVKRWLDSVEPSAARAGRQAPPALAAGSVFEAKPSNVTLMYAVLSLVSVTLASALL